MIAYSQKYFSSSFCHRVQSRVWVKSRLMRAAKPCQIAQHFFAQWRAEGDVVGVAPAHEHTANLLPPIYDLHRVVFIPPMIRPPKRIVKRRVRISSGRQRRGLLQSVVGFVLARPGLRAFSPRPVSNGSMPSAHPGCPEFPAWRCQS